MRAMAFLAAVASSLLIVSSANAGFLYYFDINMQNATCNNGQVCTNDEQIDPIVFQPPVITTTYDLLYHTTSISQAVGYDPDGSGEFDIFSPRSAHIFLTDLYFVPIIDGTFDFIVNGMNYTAGPAGTRVRLQTNDHYASIIWSNANVVGLAHIAGYVPEPASWALMIGGLGLAGATLRRRRSASQPI